MTNADDLTSPPERRETAPGAVIPRPAVPPPVAGETALEWLSTRGENHASAMIHERDDTAEQAQNAAIADWRYPLLIYNRGATLQEFWEATWFVSPTAYPLDPVTGRVTLGTARTGGTL